MNQNHIINCLVENKPGVLARIVGLISGRGYNIETLNVAPTTDPTVSKMTIVVPGDARVIEQVTRQLAKQVDVIEVVNMTKSKHIERELILVRVKTSKHNSHNAVIKFVSQYNAQVIDIQRDSVVVEMVGDQDEVAMFLDSLNLPKMVIESLSRSGVIAVGCENV